MDFGVLPGPPLAEAARTTLVRAVAATVTWEGQKRIPPLTVPVRADRTGRPVLLPSAGSLLACHLAASEPTVVTLAVPADAPFSVLRLTGSRHA